MQELSPLEYSRLQHAPSVVAACLSLALAPCRPSGGGCLSVDGAPLYIRAQTVAAPDPQLSCVQELSLREYSRLQHIPSVMAAASARPQALCAT